MGGCVMRQCVSLSFYQPQKRERNNKGGYLCQGIVIIRDGG